VNKQPPKKPLEETEKACECQICFYRWHTFSSEPQCSDCGNKDVKLIEVKEV